MIRNPSPIGATNQLDDILRLTQGSQTSNGFRRVLGSIVGTAGNILMPGIGGAIGTAIAGTAYGAANPIMGAEVGQYLALQQQMNNESLAISTASTILKARHDAAMDCIRNMK